MDSLVSTEWLAGELGASDLRVVDATMILPEYHRDARAEFEAAHIPGAAFLDLDELRDTDSDLPNTLPSAEKFASRMQSLGLGDGSRIVVYDDSPSRTSARAWWMFRLFGAHEVAILDGGIAKWKAEGRETESGRPTNRHRHFTVFRDDASLADKAGVQAALDGGGQVVDARTRGRFAGEEPEARPGLVAGHMPGAKNLPYARLFNADGTWKRGDELRQAFADANVDPGKPMITTCGSGVTAAVLAFGAHLLGNADARVYDGSWSEWGGDPSTPKATGAA
ncbi:sulfurtransferase [Sphingomonas gilva]|uniref:Sulfurtransferase n=1 Tax=Sphingomonas gilva TaxID=2305907 RepID=A0A396RRN3_9SPHN|nr:sulfurtransferase [Sphingomonas gilva]RHW17982.1 sulfurtransferase [Sphingomonas gilva]